MVVLLPATSLRVCWPLMPAVESVAVIVELPGLVVPMIVVVYTFPPGDDGGGCGGKILSRGLEDEKRTVSPPTALPKRSVMVAVATDCEIPSEAITGG